MKRIGRHMPTHSRPLQAAQIARQLGCTTIQIFTSNPRSWQPAADDAMDCAAFARAARDLGLDPLVIHAPYLINLASPDEFIWEKSIFLLRWTLQRGALLGAKYVIFHTGSHRGSGVEAGIARIAQAITRIFESLPEMDEPVQAQETPTSAIHPDSPVGADLSRPAPMYRPWGAGNGDPRGGSPGGPALLLENDVGGGNSLGHNVEQLGAVLDLLPQYSERLGVCLDSAHLWGAGHDISNPLLVQEMLRRFDEVIGLARLHVIHLNDTKLALGSHRDVHARLGEGIIAEAGLRALLNDPRLAHVVILLETPILLGPDGKEDWEHDKQHFERAKGLLESQGPEM